LAAPVADVLVARIVGTMDLAYLEVGISDSRGVTAGAGMVIS
jgi:hypothetical protein